MPESITEAHHRFCASREEEDEVWNQDLRSWRNSNHYIQSNPQNVQVAPLVRCVWVYLACNFLKCNFLKIGNYSPGDQCHKNPSRTVATDATDTSSTLRSDWIRGPCAESHRQTGQNDGCACGSGCVSLSSIFEPPVSPNCLSFNGLEKPLTDKSFVDIKNTASL